MDKPSLVEDLKKAWYLLILIGCGCVCLIYVVRELYDSKTMNNWPQTQGTIEESLIAYRESVHRSGARRRTITLYSPEISYSYIVEGRSYKNNQLTLGGNEESSDKEKIRPIINRFPEGKNVTVYYHPSDHQRSVLVLYTQSRDIRTSLVFGLLLIGINSLIFYRHSEWCQYQFNYVPEREVKEQPAFMKRRLSRRERKQQQLRQR